MFEILDLSASQQAGKISDGSLCPVDLGEANDQIRRNKLSKKVFTIVTEKKI